MRLRIFKADKGDCLLLTGADGRHVLIDGGMSASFTEHVAKFLSSLDELELVYVSHIDRDHVQGLIQMMSDHLEWKVHDFQVEENDHPEHPEPDVLRPPTVKKIWQNAFHEQADDNDGRIEDLLGAQANMLSGHESEVFRELAQEMSELATSVGDAIKLSRRIGENQLDIPLNPEFDEGLMFVTDPPDPIRIGGMRITVIGPFAEELDALREDWNTWLEEKSAELERIQRANARDEERLLPNDAEAFLETFLAEAKVLAEDEDIAAAADDFAQAKVLGRRRKVTVPNLASLMLFVEENGKTVLLTGDGHCDDIIAGLENAGIIGEGEGLHVDVLKVPHHGSEHNTSEEFAKRVTADDYIFCSNGSHDNPDVDVVRAYVDSRVGTDEQKSSNAEVNRSFKLWFNYSSSNKQKGKQGKKNKKHLKKVEKEVKKRANQSSKVRFEFLGGGHKSFTV